MNKILPYQNFLFKNWQYTIRLRSNHCQNLYETLEVAKDCTNQEIREAFVKLSKKFHPDVKGAGSDPNHSEQFVKISEAYQILSKPKAREAYDHHLKLCGNNSNINVMRNTDVVRPWEIKPDINPNPGPYYGVKGLNRISNTKIALFLIFLTIFGTMFGFSFTKYRFTINRQQIDEKSEIANSHHAHVRADALKYGNEEQLKRMAKRMMRDNR